MVVPAWAGVPVATFGINVVGAFLLGVLLELLAKHGLDIGWSRRVRLGVGTGALGGFTTSALAVETATLAATWSGRAIAYGLGTVIVGGMASVAGIWLSRGHQRPGIVEPNKNRDAAGTALLVCTAGGIGAALRFVLDGLIRTRVHATYPVATTVINLSGSPLARISHRACSKPAIAASMALDSRHRAAWRLHHFQHRELRNRPAPRRSSPDCGRPQRTRHADRRHGRRALGFGIALAATR